MEVNGHDIRPKADLRGADLKWVELPGAKFSRANLQGADLRRASFQRADFQGAELQRANLQDASFVEANLRDANLQETSLERADLRRADLRGARLPAPTMVLLAGWGRVADVDADLCVACMLFDAANHPRPEAFDAWGAGGGCPYAGVRVSRCVNFQEKRALWPGSDHIKNAPTAYKLMARLLETFCIWEAP